jgi:PHD/YefM family antitoxin component YafN of YafNO toxin-antitoxin module
MNKESMTKKCRNDTIYLMSNPANTKHLMESIQQHKDGLYAVKVKDLKELK